MRKEQPKLLILAALVGLVLAGPALRAEDSASSSDGFRLWADPIVLGVLETDVDTDSARFQEYSDLGSGFRGALHIAGESEDGNRTFDFRAVNLSRDDARYTLEYGVAARWNLLIDYNKIPHRFGNNAKLLWNRTGPGVYEIADPVQATIQGVLDRQAAINRSAINFAFLDNLIAPYLAAAQEVDLALQRDRTRARFELGRMGKLAWAMEVNHENRTGNRPFGASFGFNNVNELPEPIDYDTTTAELSGEWWVKNGGVRFGYRRSVFENNISTLIWDNPFRSINSTDANAYQSPSSSSINGATRGFADLAADNEADTIYADGRARFGSWWMSGGLAYSIQSQDDPLLPYTLNTAIRGVGAGGATFDPTNNANLPVRSGDLEVKTLGLNAEAGTRFADDFSLTFRYRYYDHDNTSERIEFPGYVRFQSVWEDIGRITVPYAYTRQNLGADLSWDVSSNTSLGLGYRHETWDREYREVESQDEDVLALTLDSRPIDKLAVRLKYEYGDRSIDSYEVEAQEFSFTHPEGVNNAPLLRKFDEAARKFNGWNAQMEWFPTDAWSLTVGASSRDDDYDESVLGLLADEIFQYNTEISFNPGENFNFYAFAHIADRDVLQVARQAGATPSTRELDNWEAAFEEKNTTFGLGLTSKFAERYTLNVNGQWNESDGYADFFAAAGGLPLGTRASALDFGNYEDIELLSFTGRLDYKLNDKAAFGFWYRYEDFTIDSFILQGLRNYLPGALLLNASNGDYQADIFAVELTLGF
ncbi:MAG TPA: MtrB/PioB family decaheme-associated outer membrane protein [Thermoanaerobaculia bacterium]|nr:MtrB/PioB family decaheme-associated outer membrane protein [Thermoanaerobaculia bacterium]